MLDIGVGERYRIGDRYGSPEPETFAFKKKPKRVQHHFNYSQLEHDPQGPFVIPNLLSFGEYDNSGTVERSNNRVFKEQFASLEHREWWPIGGNYGEGVVVRVDADERHEDLREFFDSLANYPLADEDDHSQMEMEQEEENWRDYGAGDFEREVRKYAPEELQERLEKALEGHTFELFRAMNEATGSYPEQESTSTLFHEERMVWETLAKATDEEWGQFVFLLEDEKTNWDYRGDGYTFVRGLHDRKLSQNELVALAWKKYGREQFKAELAKGFRDTWGWGNVEKLSEVERNALEAAFSTLQNLPEGSYDALAWGLLFPIWDEKNTEGYRAVVQGYWAEPVRFEMHWLTRYFARWALHPEFAVLLDGLAEGTTKHLPDFVPMYREFFAQQR